MRDCLKNTGRPIVYSICCWRFDGDWQMDGGNSWRTTSDIAATWNLMGSITDQNHPLFPNAAPGQWNDPDMLEIGNGTLTAIENMTHMSLWCIMAAPLLAGNDVRSMTTAVKDVYCNTEAIAVDQDSLGVQGRRVRDEGDYEVWLKPLKSWIGQEKAVVLFNRSNAAKAMNVRWDEIGLDMTKTATVRDLWKHQDMGSFTGEYSTSVAAHGTAMLIIKGEPGITQFTQDSYLGDIAWYHMANGLGPAEKNKSNGEQAAGDGKTITLAGTTCSKGLGVHAPSELVYYLGGKGGRFSADVGVDDEVANAGSVQFIVFGDMKKLYASGAMTGATATKKVEVDVTGVQVLRLLVTQNDLTTTSDHADWANARVTYSNVAVKEKPVALYSPNVMVKKSLLRYTVLPSFGVAPLVTIRLFDLKGVLLGTLVHDRKSPGAYTLDLNDARIGAGSYLCNVKMDNFTETVRIIKSE